ncbi:MAG: hypothetical protein ABJ218_10035, partial [Winogradskyella arenosi]
NSLTGGTNATGIDFVRSNSDWIAYVAFIDGGGVYRLNFGNWKATYLSRMLVYVRQLLQVLQIQNYLLYV